MPVARIGLDGQMAVVTGGAGELGRAIARRLLRSGAGVSLWDSDGDRLDLVSRELQSSALRVVVADLTSAAEVEKATHATLTALGRLDILINNAGVLGPVVELWLCDPEDWRHVVAVNLTSAFLCCRAIIPIMLRQGRGRIVNVSSIQGKEGTPRSGPYSAAKAGVIGLTKTLGQELATSGVTVNCVTPAAFQGPMLTAIDRQRRSEILARIPMGRFGTAEEIAGMVAWLCSPECSFSTGAVFDVSGGRATY